MHRSKWRLITADLLALSKYVERINWNRLPMEKRKLPESINSITPAFRQGGNRGDFDPDPLCPAYHVSMLEVGEDGCILDPEDRGPRLHGSMHHEPQFGSPNGHP